MKLTDISQDFTPTGAAKYLCNNMQPGDMIEVPIQLGHALRPILSQLSAQQGKKFISRREGDHIEFWRLK